MPLMYFLSCIRLRLRDLYKWGIVVNEQHAPAKALVSLLKQQGVWRVTPVFEPSDYRGKLPSLKSNLEAKWSGALIKREWEVEKKKKKETQTNLPLCGQGSEGGGCTHFLHTAPLAAILRCPLNSRVHPAQSAIVLSVFDRPHPADGKRIKVQESGERMKYCFCVYEKYRLPQTWVCCLTLWKHSCRHGVLYKGMSARWGRHSRAIQLVFRTRNNSHHFCADPVGLRNVAAGTNFT